MLRTVRGESQDCENMAVLVDIKRLNEDEAHADYSFMADGASQPGVLRIDKATGEVSLVQAMVGSSTADAHFHRAAHKIRQHWKQGSLPATAVWAS